MDAIIENWDEAKGMKNAKQEEANELVEENQFSGGSECEMIIKEPTDNFSSHSENDSTMDEDDEDSGAPQSGNY